MEWINYGSTPEANSLNYVIPRKIRGETFGKYASKLGSGKVEFMQFKNVANAFKIAIRSKKISEQTKLDTS